MSLGRTRLPGPSLTSVLALALASVAPSIARAQVTITDPNFVLETIHSGNGMVTIEPGPGGRLYVCEKRGRVLHFAPNGNGGFNAPTVFLDITANVAWEQESGLLGIALDPDFANNRHMFLFHSTTNGQQIIRVTANAGYDAAVAGSSTTILSGFPRNVGTHKAGDIHFHPNDPNNLYVVLGDDGQPSAVDNLDVYPGKILKISKTNGQGLATNPFQNGNLNSVRSRIWAHGFRNPFRFTFHPLVPQADVIYVSENGNQTDRIVRVSVGADGAWGTGGDNGGFLNPPDARARVMNTQAPFLVGIQIVRGGPFGDPADPNASVLYVSNGRQPTMRGSVSRFRLTGANYDTLSAVPADNGQPFINGLRGMDMKIIGDSMFLTDTGSFESTGTTYTLTRVRRVGGAPPTAAFTMNPSPARGSAPLSVTFTDGSSDSDGQVVSWSWSFGDGGTSAQRSPTYTFQNAGVYTVRLTATDDSGLTAQATGTVTAIRTTSLTLRGRVYDGRNLDGAGLATTSQLRLYQADGTTPLAFTGGTGASGNGIDVPSGGMFDRTVSVELTGNGVVVSAGEGSAELKAAYRGFEVNAGAPTHTQDLSFHLSSTAIRGRIRDTRGVAASVDVGVARGNEGALYAFAGGRDYLPASGLPASSIAHRMTSDAFGYYYVPVRTGDGNATFFFGVVADTNRDTYVSSGFTEMIPTNGLVTHDITLGLKMGGGMCDDLAGQAPTPNVDYESQIQPIWDASCTGCHNSSSGNGNLTLESPSWARLVNVQSLEVPGQLLVAPGNPAQSFLFEKLNCANPQVGTQMRPLDRLPLAQQQLIADWITQGALERAAPPMDGGVPAGDAAVGEDAAAPFDAGFDDAGNPIDAGPRPDSGSVRDAGPSDPSLRSATRGGCGCTSVESGRTSSWGAIAALALVLVLRRRRRA
ncbi:PQQ-dependent sugar dehydrogenase [Myxococcota bacterium]|nr:PQQ-dependent sugar dehydrogenase [Myxococcota bacterium]